jgi:hypothetical protein
MAIHPKSGPTGRPRRSRADRKRGWRALIEREAVEMIHEGGELEAAVERIAYEEPIRAGAEYRLEEWLVTELRRRAEAQLGDRRGRAVTIPAPLRDLAARHLAATREQLARDFDMANLLANREARIASMPDLPHDYAAALADDWTTRYLHGYGPRRLNEAQIAALLATGRQCLCDVALRHLGQSGMRRDYPETPDLLSPTAPLRAVRGSPTVGVLGAPTVRNGLQPMV